MFRSSIDKRLVTLTAPASMEAEQYQALRLKLERMWMLNVDTLQTLRYT